MKKKTLLMIMIMCLFVGSTLFGIPNNNMRVPLEEELDPIVKEPNFEVPESPQTKTVPSGWQLGESVEVVHSFTTKTAKRVIDTYPNEALASTTITGDLSRTYESDDIYQKIFCNVAVDCDEPYPDYNNFFMGTFLYMLSFEYEIEVKVAGSVWVECESIYITNKGTNTGFDETSYVSVTQEHISSGGNTKLKVCAFAGEEMDIALVYYLFNYEDSDWDSTVADTSDDSTVGCAFTSLELKVDRIYFTPTNITEKIRSEYSYFSESVIIHKLEIFNVDYGTSITIKKPSYWSYSSVNFDCSVSDSTDTILTNTLPTIYEILYISNNSYFLAIEEKTDSYLTDIGFENGQWNNDWDDISSQMTSVEISTDIVSEGYHSLKLVSTASGNFYLSTFGNVKLREGQYYVSFDLYVDSSAGSIYFKPYEDGFWSVNYAYESGVDSLDRWIKCFFYIDLDMIGTAGSNERNIAFNFGSVATVYIDNFRIYESSTEIETIDLDEYSISSTFVVWDGYQNSILSNEDVYLSLIDRTAKDFTILNEPIFNKLLITNENGLVSYVYDGSLEQKEYEIKAFAKDSEWDNNYDQDFNDVSEWDYFLSFASHSENYNSNTDEHTITLGQDGNRYGYFGFDSLTTYDFIDNLVLFFDIKSNETNIELDSQYAYETGSGTVYIRNNTVVDLTTSYQTNIQFIDLFDCYNDLSVYTSNQFRLRVDTDINEFFELTFRNIHFIQATSFFFTPEYSYNIDYAENVLSDSWDFSEGDDEGFYDNRALTIDDIKNGYLSFYPTINRTNGDAYMNLKVDLNENLDTTYYNFISIKVKTNATFNYKIYGIHDTVEYVMRHYHFSTYIINNEWIILSGFIDIEKTIISNLIFCFTSNSYASGGFNTTDFIFIDFIRLISIDSLSYFTTDTTITFESDSIATGETNQLINKVWSDGQLLGDYTEPSIVPLNCTLSVNHNITRVPFARAGVSKAFLYSETTQYTYLISIASNYFTSLRVSIDAAGGLLYVGYLTYWGNTTIRVADNGTWLGSAQNEGNTIWSFDETNYGLHNFTLYFYNGGDTWVSFSTSVTIVEPDLTVLALSYYEKHYDADAGHIYLNYDTTWGNTTIRVSDNSSWLGAAVSGEGLSIWTTNSDYGLHNITIIIYNDGVEWFTDIFTFTYNQPSQIWREVLFRFTSSVTGATIDSEKYLRIFIDDQLVSAGTVTYLENFNITIYDRFNNELYTSTNTLYAAIIDVALPLRLVNFTNPNAVACRYELWKGSYARELIIASLATESYYLFDSNYTLIAEALDPHYLDNIQYILTDSTFTVEVGMATITITLNTYEQTDFLMSFTFTSSYTGGTIDAENYLMIFLNGTKIDSSVNVWSKDNFELLITDNFDNILYDSTIGYSRVVAITLAMRQFTFTNMEQEATTIDIQQSGSDGVLFFPLAIAGTIPVWLTDGSYTVTHSPRDPDKETNVLWTSKSYNFDCSISSQTLSMYLDQFEIVDAPTDFMSSIREYFQENMNMMIVVLVTLVIVAIIVIVSTVVIVQKVSELILLMKKKKNQTEE